MKTLVKSVDVDVFFDRLAEARNRVLFLDYDGTLAPFTEERDRAVVYPGVTDRLRALIDIPSVRLVIVSGRGVKDVRPLLRLAATPEIWGSHGWERLLPGGDRIAFPIERRAAEGLARTWEWVKKNRLDRRAERKVASVALHWRDAAAPEAESLCRRAAEDLAPIAAIAGLHFRPFDGGIEVISPGRNKGDAVTTVLDEFADPVVSSYLGDDETDEDAFLALGEGGLGVLVRKEYRDTAAKLWIEPPGELLDYLDRWIEVCS